MPWQRIRLLIEESNGRFEPLVDSALAILDRYSGFAIGVPRNHCAQVAFSSTGAPKRQVFVDGVKEKAAFRKVTQGT
jgi:hypothetical protein